MPSPLTILVPRTAHPAIEERYAFAQSRMLLTANADARVVEYEPGAQASAVAAGIDSEIVVVLTDPLLIVPPGTAEALSSLLRSGSAEAIVPVASDSAVELQRAVSHPLYLTLSQFREAAAAMHSGDVSDDIEWPDADPGLFAIRARLLRESSSSIRGALTGRRVAAARGIFVHRFASQRGQNRPDLLGLVSTDARRVLEFGCGEGAFAASLKARQPCRVVGVELDPESAAIARSRVDLLLGGDVREVVRSIDETFDWIVGGDILEHLDDPWQFLTALRRLCEPDGRLLLSLPNVACWPIVRDLLAGRFDYVYMGITCAGHLRFFTRGSIDDMLRIAGWKTVSMIPQPEFRTPAYDAFLAELKKTTLPFSEEELLAPGYYVQATPAR